MSESTSIWLFILPFAIAAAIPGPAQGALMGQVISRGARASLPFVYGMILGNAAWLVIATLGLAALAVEFEQVFIAIKWLGVAFILFVAWGLWSKSVDRQEEVVPRSASRGLIAGSTLTLSNPKAVVFFGAVLPQAFDLTALALSEVILITLLGIGIDLVIQLSYLLTATKVKGVIQSPKAIKRLNRGSACVMAGCAGWMARSH